jgi:hypothetical protein
MKRRWLLLFAAFVVAVLGAGWLLVPFEQGRISQATCDRIQLGVSEERVLKMLGEQRKVSRIATLDTDANAPYACELWWRDEDDNRILVNFGPKGQVTGKRFLPTERSVFEKLKRRIRALWP